MGTESDSVNMDQFSADSKFCYRVKPGDAITRWEVTEPVETLFPGKARAMPDRLTYCFQNGWVDTGDLPCRESLREWLPLRQVAMPSGPFGQIYWGTEGPEVDYSAFRHRPTLVSRGFRCRVTPDYEGVLQFRMATCGGLNLWMGDVHEAHEPFDRNRLTAKTISIPVVAKPVDLLLLLEDLHERDTKCCFSLVHIAGPSIKVSVGTDTNAEALANAASVLEHLRPSSLFSESGATELVSDVRLSSNIDLEIVGPTLFPRGGLTHDPLAPTAKRWVKLTPDHSRMHLFDAETAPSGCLRLEVSTTVGDVRLFRRLCVTNLPSGIRLRGDLQGRKAQAAEAISAGLGFEPSVAALLAVRSERDDHVAQVVEATLATIEQRYDCSDFSILPLLRLWRDAAHTLPDATRERLRTAFLNYRYWYDVPGNDVMWFWSENHALCFHASQYIAGLLFADEVFTAHDMTGIQMATIAEDRLNRWFDAITRNGLCEWNSAAYYPIDLMGLFSLYDMAPDFKHQAGALLDRIFLMVALHTTGGVPAGSQGRAYEKELLAGPATELGGVAVIAFGGEFRPGYDRASSLFCMTDYAPPDEIGDLLLPENGRAILARYTQGHGHAGKLTLWKSAVVQLSTVADLKPGEEGHQAHVLDVQFAAHPMARLWINHPGELKEWGEGRPSLLAGNHVMPAVAQYGRTAMLLFDLDKPWTQIAMTQLFAAPQAFCEIVWHADWLVFRSGKGLAAVWCSEPLQSVDGAFEGALHRAYGLQSAWIVTLAQDEEDFGRQLDRMKPVFHRQISALHATEPDGSFMEFSFQGHLKVDGISRPFGPLSPVPHIGYEGGVLHPWRAANG